MRLHEADDTAAMAAALISTLRSRADATTDLHKPKLITAADSNGDIDTDTDSENTDIGGDGDATPKQNRDDERVHGQEDRGPTSVANIIDVGKVLHVMVATALSRVATQRQQPEEGEGARETGKQALRLQLAAALEAELQL